MKSYPKTKFSINIIKHLKNIIENDENLNSHLSNCLNISKKNSKFLKDNYLKIINNYKYFIKNLNIIEESVFDVSSASSMIAEYNPFVGNQILKEIEKMTFNTKITYIDNNSNNKLIFYLSTISKNSLDELRTTLHEMAYRIFTINSLFYNKDEIIYFITPSEHKKKLSKKRVPLSGININTGSTLAIGLGPIKLWRSEEILKVCIHELIHCLRFDIKNYPSKELKRFYEEFCINDKGCNHNFPSSCETAIFPNEGYTEIMAQIVNTMFFYYHNSGSSDFDTNIYLSMLSLEVLWGFIQLNKILEHYGYNNINSFFKSNKKNMCSVKLIQHTNVFSYFFIRVGLYSNFNKFLNFINNTNKNFMKINSEEDNLTNFTTLIINSIKSSNLINGVKISNKIYKNLEKNKKYHNSLRMSILE